MIEKCEIIFGTKDELVEYFKPLISEKSPQEFLTGKLDTRSQLKEVEDNFKHGIGMIFYIAEKPEDNGVKNLILMREYVRIKKDEPKVNIC